jgi:hypothetical protein
LSTQADLPIEPGERDPDSPEYGFNPLAIVGTVKKIRAEIDAIKAFLVKIAPVLDAIKAAMGNPAPAQTPGEFSMHAEQLQSTQPE